MSYNVLLPNVLLENVKYDIKLVRKSEVGTVT